MDLKKWTKTQCEYAIKIVDSDDYVEITGFGKIHVDNFTRRINELES